MPVCSVIHACDFLKLSGFIAHTKIKVERDTCHFHKNECDCSDYKNHSCFS